MQVALRLCFLFEAGAFDLQAALHDEFFVRTIRCFNTLQQQLNCGASDVFRWLTDDGQRWFDHIAPCGFVKSDQCNVLRNADVVCTQGLECADGDEVVTGENAVGFDVATQQLHSALVALFNAWRNEVCTTMIQIGITNGAFKSFATIKTSGTGVTKKPDQTAAALSQHVLGQCVRCGNIIQHHCIVVRIVFHTTVNDDKWNVCVVRFTCSAELLGRGEDHAGDVFIVHQVQIHQLFFRVLIGVANND